MSEARMMKTYICWVVGRRERTTEEVVALSSLAARVGKSLAHNVDLMDIAVRVK